MLALLWLDSRKSLSAFWAATCLVAALLSTVISWGPLHCLFEDCKDGPDVTYLILGLPFVVLSVALLVAAVWLVLSASALDQSSAGFALLLPSTPAGDRLAKERAEPFCSLLREVRPRAAFSTFLSRLS